MPAGTLIEQEQKKSGAPGIRELCDLAAAGLVADARPGETHFLRHLHPQRKWHAPGKTVHRVTR